MEEHHHPLPPLLRGDDGRAVLERGPGAAGQVAVRSARICRRTPISAAAADPRTALGGEGGEGLRAVPGERAAERASAPRRRTGTRGSLPAARRGPQSAGAGRRHPRTPRHGPASARRGRPHRRAPARRPARRASARWIPQHPWPRAAPARRHRVRAPARDSRSAPAAAGLIAGAAEDEADPAAAPALVHQGHGSGGALAGDLEAADAVAQFHRHVEADLALGSVRREGEDVLGERQALRVEGADEAVSRPLEPARRTWAVRRPPVSAADSARAGGRSAFRMVRVAPWRPTRSASCLPNPSPPGPATPSLIQRIAVSGLRSRKPPRLGRAASRSAQCGAARWRAGAPGLRRAPSPPGVPPARPAPPRPRGVRRGRPPRWRRWRRAGAPASRGPR